MVSLRQFLVSLLPFVFLFFFCFCFCAVWDQGARGSIMAVRLVWQKGESFEVQEGGKTVKWTMAGTHVAIADTPFDLTSDFFVQIELKTNNHAFPESMMAGLSNEAMYVSGAKAALGSTKKSWGIRIDGKIFHNGVQKYYANELAESRNDKKYHRSCLVGIHFHASSGEVRFFDGEKDLGVAFKIKDKETPLYPAACFASCNHLATFIEQPLGETIKPAKR